ncbi:MAG: metallophosphoesterase [Thermomicrobiales bacterium]|nr:metallophosphoesterase [Thermomicrobiales bacterium]
MPGSESIEHAAGPSPAIPALVPAGEHGHQFVCYADCCSGIPGRGNVERFAAVNAVLKRLDPPPEFICFPGDEIQGLTADPALLREQWRFWFEEEMSWLDRDAIPLYHTTGNHTVYDPQSEAIFRDVMAHLPRNGPPGQEGLSYVIRRGDLVMVFVNTLWSGLGGEGRVETEWLDATLATHSDATFKLVFGHHPVFPVNGFSGICQREIEPENGRAFWDILVRHGVMAYCCSHILAFDVQVHQGVLQLLTAGAGTEPGMPESEYRHLVQIAIDRAGVRYQVLDTAGMRREWLTWPPALPPSSDWTDWPHTDVNEAREEESSPGAPEMIAWRFTAKCSNDGRGDPQTLLCGWHPGAGLETTWIGLRGPEQRLCVLLSPEPGRSPHLWLGPPLCDPTPRHTELLADLPSGRLSDSFQVAIHRGMGPGGILWRWDDQSPWTSMTAASPWGAERIIWPAHWGVGHSRGDVHAQPFRGDGLGVSGFRKPVTPLHP